MVVGVPQAQLLHHLLTLLAVIGQVGLAVLCQHTLVAHAVVVDLVARGFIADDAVSQIAPHARGSVAVER